MHDYVKTLGTVIRKAREEQGMSQASLAEKLGIDVRTIINIENFRGNPKFEVLYPLVTTLRIPADRIFYPCLLYTKIQSCPPGTRFKQSFQNRQPGPMSRSKYPPRHLYAGTLMISAMISMVSSP